MQQFIHTVLETICIGRPTLEAEIHQEIINGLNAKGVAYFFQPTMLIPYSDGLRGQYARVIVHEGQCFRATQPDFLIGSSILEIKMASNNVKISASSLRQLAEYLSIKGIEDVFYAVFDDQWGEYKYCRRVGYLRGAMLIGNTGEVSYGVR